MLAKRGYQAKHVGSRRVCTEGFTGEPVLGTVQIYELHLRLGDNSPPVIVRSHEFPDHQTNVKTLLFGRVDIWDKNWFPDRDPTGKPSLRWGRRFKPLVRAKEHLFRPQAYDLRQPEPYARPDQPANGASSEAATPDLVGSIREVGGWYTRPAPSSAPKGALRSYGQYLARSMQASDRKTDRGVLDAIVDLVPRKGPPSIPSPQRSSISPEEDRRLVESYESVSSQAWKSWAKAYRKMPLKQRHLD